MRFARLQLAAFVAVALFAPAARSAPAPRHLGQVAPFGKEVAGCTCTAVQFSDPGTLLGSYEIPYDGVIVKTALTVGVQTEPGDTFQAQTVHKTGAASGTVASAGALHGISGLSHSTHTFYDRFPAAAHDVLASRIHTATAFDQYTTALFHTTGMFDKAASVSALGVGESFGAAPVEDELRVNVESYLEPDEDHDGYGDVSQDLCPANPIGGGACSGSLFGPDFEGMQGGYGGVGSDSLYVQTGLRGAPTALAAPGVVVRWRVLGGFSSDAQFQLRILAPKAGGGYTVARSSALETVPKNLNDEAGQIGSFPARLPVPAGGYVGLATGPLFTVPSQLSGGPAGSTLSKLVDGGDGTSYSGLPTTSTAEFGYDADIEPDVDGDGFGDVTQDACPAAASAQTAPCPLPPSVAGPPANVSTPSKATISGFKATPKSFQVKPHGGGTNLKLTLSKAAKVTFTFEQKLLCGTKAKARCKAGFHALGSFAKSLPGGKSSVAFAGKVKGKELTPGSYRVTAVAAAGGVEGSPARTMLTVLGPPTSGPR